jgi:FMN phosphatase YigB (HAD superfamily)
LRVSTSLIKSLVKTLDALDITPLLTAGTTISQLAGYEKPDPRIYDQACLKAGIIADPSATERGPRYPGVLMVGDELEADYRGSLRAGLEPRLLRRPGEFSDGAKRLSESEERDMLAREGVHVVRSLDELVAEVSRRNAKEA